MESATVVCDLGEAGVLFRREIAAVAPRATDRAREVNAETTEANGEGGRCEGDVGEDGCARVARLARARGGSLADGDDRWWLPGRDDRVVPLRDALLRAMVSISQTSHEDVPHEQYYSATVPRRKP